jgi:LmbE family N-acetylglucosaminyl deacetylase
MGKKVLILSAHPDDAVTCMGGTICKLQAEGHSVSVFAFGNGDEDYAEPGGSAEAVRRYRENTEKAYAILGCQLECLWLPDFADFQTRELYRECIRAIRKYQPDIVFAHWWAEYFQHTTMATISRDAWNQARWLCSGDLGAPWKPAKYYHFSGADGVGQITHIVDISPYIERKLDAHRAFAFRFFDKDNDDAENVRKRNAYEGSLIGVDYAETFQRSFYFPEPVTDTTALF